MATWLTINDLARRLDRPESTIRSWRDRFRPWVPERTNDDGRKVYPLERLAEIGSLQQQRLTAREIRAELERRHGAGDELPSPAPDRLDLILTELRTLREQVDYLVERERLRGEP